MKKPLVGLNYAVAWDKYGIYFGSGNPPGSQPVMDAWTKNLKNNLIFLRDQLNIGIVRIFLLGNAANFGTVKQTVFSPGRRVVVQKFDYTAPAIVDPRFTQQLQQMLLAFRDTSMMVIPSIIDFKAIGRNVVLKPAAPEKTVNGSRIKAADAVTNGCTDRHDIVQVESIRKQFFQQMHDNLLVPSLPFASNIYAWEVQNEPSWNYRTIAGQSVAGGATVSEDEMRQFLKEGIETINSVQLNGKPAFKTTVGHRFLEDLDDLPTGTRRQFHFYPFSLTQPKILSPFLPDIPVRDRELPRFNDTNAFLGEIGIEDPSADHGDLWPDLNRADEGDTQTRVAARLQHVREQGYPLVLLWPDGIDGKGRAGPVTGPDPIHLSAKARAGIIDFMKSV